MSASSPFPDSGFLALAAGGAASFADAVAKVEADARAGNPAAALLLSTLSAAGVGMPQSWTRALSCLVDAARAGSVAAQGQLRVLASDRGASDGDPWAALAATVPIASWTATRDKRVLNTAPRVVAIADFLPRPVCDWLVGLAVGRLKPALVYDGGGGAQAQSTARSNSFLEFGLFNCDVVVLLTRLRIATAIGVPVGALENSQILHYDVGEQFIRHHDYLDPGLPDVAERGQRIVTFLVYLNDAFDGGETDFPRLGLSHRGRTGDALYFGNLDAAGAPDPRTLHAGLAPTRGEKWVFSQWVRNRARV